MAGDTPNSITGAAHPTADRHRFFAIRSNIEESP
jgi:hypothetical protein